MGPVKLFERAASTAAHALRHPVSSAAYAAGLARGLAGAALHGATVTGHDPEAGHAPIPTQRTGSAAEPTTGPRKPERVVKPVPTPDSLPEPVVIEAVDEDPGESFATEPKAVSRESAHGQSAHGGSATDAEIDAWIDEAMARGGEIDTQEADLRQPGTGPLLDPGAAKAIRSESEMMKKDAERDPE